MNIAFSAVDGTGADNRPSPRLVAAAHEFEASLMQELLKPLQENSLFASAEDSAQHGSNETLMSFGSQALAKALSEHGGLGIATRILGHFCQKAETPEGKPPVAAERTVKF